MGLRFVEKILCSLLKILAQEKRRLISGKDWFQGRGGTEVAQLFAWKKQAYTIWVD